MKNKPVIKFSIIPKMPRGLDHLEAQKKYRASVFRDKTKYTRKIKHKNKEDY